MARGGWPLEVDERSIDRKEEVYPSSCQFDYPRVASIVGRIMEREERIVVVPRVASVTNCGGPIHLRGGEGRSIGGERGP